MTPLAAAEMLERFASRVWSIRNVDRLNPHIFVDDKSEVAGDMIAEARRLRTMSAPRTPARPVSDIATGARTIGRRNVAVVTRARRA